MKERDQRQSRDRLIGILGGMGPEATLDLYRYMLKLTPASRDQDHIRVLIYSNPKIPDRTKAITGAGESPLDCLIQSAMLLEKGGAGVIAMPCNAAHYYLPEMQKRVHIPILDMIAETCNKLSVQLPRAKTAGLIASLGAVRSGVYQKALKGMGVEVLLPNRAEQQKIENEIVTVKTGRYDRSSQDTFQSIGARLAKAGAQVVILGCTEVPLAFDADDVDYPTLNSTKILAEAAVDWALGKSSWEISRRCSV